MAMQSLALIQVFCCIVPLLKAQRVMFAPDNFYSRQACTDNNNCASGCCLIVEETDREMIGICQPMGQFGQYCAPGERLKDVGGSKVYTYSCPCQPGLLCKPLWIRQEHGVTAMQDPKCTPTEISPHSPVISRFLYNAFPDVPIE